MGDSSSGTWRRQGGAARFHARGATRGIFPFPQIIEHHPWSSPESRAQEYERVRRPARRLAHRWHTRNAGHGGASRDRAELHHHAEQTASRNARLRRCRANRGRRRSVSVECRHWPYRYDRACRAWDPDRFCCPRCDEVTCAARTHGACKAPSAERGSSAGGVWRQGSLRVVDDVADMTVVTDEADPAVRPPRPPSRRDEDLIPTLCKMSAMCGSSSSSAPAQASNTIRSSTRVRAAVC